MEAAKKVEYNPPAEEEYVIPKNWRESVNSIMATGRALQKKKQTLTQKEFTRWVVANAGLGDSAARKLIKVATHPIISNPDYAYKIPAEWGYLYEVTFLPSERILDLIKSGDILTAKKYSIWEMRSGHRISSARGRRKNQVSVPEGESLIATAKVGMMMEAASGKDSRAVASELGLGAETFSMMKQLINLSVMEELSDDDRKEIVGYLEEIERTKNVRRYYEKARPIIKLVWGEKRTGKGSRLDSKLAKKRNEAFISSVTVIRATCDKAADMPAPYLSDSDKERVLDDLTEARKSIGKLVSTIRREEYHE